MRTDTPSSDLVVVGNGAIGMSIAVELARRGHRVAVVGQAHRPLAASAAAGAMLGCFGEVTTSLRASPSGRAKFAVDCRARREWPSWDDNLRCLSGMTESLFAARGTTVLLNTMGTAAVDSANFAAIKAALQEHGEPYECVDPEALDWFSPDELARSLRAIHIPGEHAVDAARLLAMLDGAFAALGGTIIDAAARRVDVVRGRAVAVQLANGELIKAGAVVIAAGSQSLELLDDVPDITSRIPPMVSGYGVSALFAMKDASTPSSVLRSPNRAFACGIHCVPRPNGRLYVGGTNVLMEQPREYATVRDLQFLLECAVDQLHTRLPEASVLSVQVGNRPVPADGFPLIGPLGVDGLWLATGTYRDGLHQSPLLAKHVATMIENGDGLVEEFEPFTPLRRPLTVDTRESIIEATVHQMMASGYEQRWRVTPEWPLRMQQHLHLHYAEVVDSLHPLFTPPPEFIPKMTESLRARFATYYKAWS